MAWLMSLIQVCQVRHFHNERGQELTPPYYATSGRRITVMSSCQPRGIGMAVLGAGFLMNVAPPGAVPLQLSQQFGPRSGPQSRPSLLQLQWPLRLSYRAYLLTVDLGTYPQTVC